MNTKRLSQMVLAGFLTAVSVNGWALDLTRYQGFMQPKLETTKPAKMVKPKMVEAARMAETAVTQPEKQIWPEDADASYSKTGVAKLVTIPDPVKKTDKFALPGATRFPEALTPLLTDRKNPREGISVSGNSGAFLMPSPGVLEPGKTGVAVHGRTFDLYDVNEKRYDGEAYFDTHVALTYGVYEGFEFGIDKVFTNQDRFTINEPAYINTKYQVPGNITVGGSLALEANAYSSLYVTTGVPALWVGAGLNFGPSNFRFTYKGWDYLRRAKFGGYNYRYDKAEGYADPAFFFVGGAVPVNKATHLLYDFNGDVFSLGIRLNYQKTVFFDASYVSDGDYERLPTAISHKKLQNFMFGGSVVF